MRLDINAVFIFRAAVLAPAVLTLAVTGLSGCSTISDLSPFGSNVPYAQDVKPTQARPEQPEVPVYTKSATPTPEPAAAPPAPKPTVAPPPAPAPQSSLVAPTPPAIQQAAVAPAPENETAAAAPQPGSKADETNLPTIPEERRKFDDPGTYPNLAQVPPRPVDLPTFAAAATLEKQLKADYVRMAAPSPPSPPVPSPDTLPSPEIVAAVAAPAAPSAPAAPPVEVAARDEDQSPCLTNAIGDVSPAATLKFDEGSSALTADDRAVLADAMPSVREAKGTLRILGHGDTETNSPTGAGRFGLAIARAGAVAQALAGYGIPAGRIAIGVACQDTMAAGALVQLYAES
jgi:outer membrane protein OmpA-like peptidoglycan-associated protein